MHPRHPHPTRRRFIERAVLAAAAAAAPGSPFAGATAVTRAADAPEKSPLFRISLAEWSLHRELQGKKITNLDFPAVTREFGIEAVEYVNQFFKDKADDEAYLSDLKKRCDDAGVKSLLIMCDGEGALGDPNDAKRTKAVENHHRWVRAAKFLGCHSIRVNAQSSGEYDEQMKLAADGLRRLCAFSDTLGINTIVENHGGLSSNGAWLAAVMKLVNHPRVGTLPDFGNFHDYDRYKGVAETMPFAKSVSAKTHDFDPAGNETHTDYRKMLKIVLAGATPAWSATGKYIGVEYEGGKLPERDGIAKTRDLLTKVREEMSA